jgi:hypothetical protein
VSERDHRGNVRQLTPGRANRRLKGLIVGLRLHALGGIEWRPGRFHVPADQRHPHLRHQQPRAGLDQLHGQRRKPPLNRRPLARAEVRVEMPLDQPGRPVSVPGGQRMPHGVIGQAMLFGPGGRVTVQHPHPAGLLLLQPGAEQVSEQVMVAPPAADLIQWHQEQACLLDRVQHRLAASPAGDRITQGA